MYDETKDYFEKPTDGGEEFILGKKFKEIIEEIIKLVKEDE